MTELLVVGLSGSLSTPSRSGGLVEHLLGQMAGDGVTTELIDLATLSAEGLLARRSDDAVTAALVRVAEAHIVVLGTPVYRASYTGQLKALFDLLPRDALAGTAVGAIATGASPAHSLAVDHGIRPLVASLAGLTAAGCVYVTDAELGEFPRGSLPGDVADRLRALGVELLTLARALAAGSGADT